VSHIIPRFIGNWMKKTGMTPYLRFSGDIDTRTQDLEKMKLLCGDCENLFSRWESEFAKEVFHPMSNDQPMYWYGPWLLKFAASLSWRAIQIPDYKKVKDSPTLKQISDGMEHHLAQFLLGRVKNVGFYSQHVMPVTELVEPIRPGSPMLNRYLAHAVEINCIQNENHSEMMIYVKLPMFIFFSVGGHELRRWLESSRIKKSGVLQPNTHGLDANLMPYIVDRSNHLHELMKSRSQQSKALADKALHEAIEKDPQKVANSRFMQAMLVDYEFYGKDAVVRRE
jgi:hypothetical protein